MIYSDAKTVDYKNTGKKLEGAKKDRKAKEDR